MTLAECYAEVSFGGFQLNEGSFHVVDIDTYSSPPRGVSRLPHLVRAGSLVSQRRDQERVVTVSGLVPAQHRSIATMEALRDRLLARLISGPQILKLGFQDGRYFPTAEVDGSVEIEWRLDARQAFMWTARFLCIDPYMYSVDVNEVEDNSALSLSGSAYIKDINVPVGGSAPAEPVVSVEIPGAGPYGLSRIVIQNSSFDPLLRTVLERTFLANDVILSDTANTSYQLNGVERNFTGRLIELKANQTNIVAIRTLATSAPTLNVLITWTNRWY